MTVASADYQTVVDALRRCLAHGTPLTQAETVLAIDVVQHASQSIAATYLAGTPGTGIAADDLAAMIAACPNIASIPANTILDGD